MAVNHYGDVGVSGPLELRAGNVIHTITLPEEGGRVTTIPEAVVDKVEFTELREGRSVLPDHLAPFADVPVEFEILVTLKVRVFPGDVR